MYIEVQNLKVPREAEGIMKGLLLVDLIVNSTHPRTSCEENPSEGLPRSVGHWACLQETILYRIIKV